MSFLFCISLIAIFIAVISAVWIEDSSGRVPLLVVSSKTAARPTFFLGSLIHLCILPFLFGVCFCVVRNVVFSLISLVYFLLRSRRLYCLLSMVVVVACCFSLCLSIPPYIFFLVICSVLLLVWLFFHFHLLCKTSNGSKIKQNY